MKLKEEGYSYRGICKSLGVSLGSVQHTIKTMSV
jgi:DNA-directed RNA polymerase specialized sigma24 family protein